MNTARPNCSGRLRIERALVEAAGLGRYKPGRRTAVVRRCAPQIGIVPRIAHAVVENVRAGVILPFSIDGDERTVIVGRASHPLLGACFVWMLPPPLSDPLALRLTKCVIGGTACPVGGLAQQPLLACVAIGRGRRRHKRGDSLSFESVSFRPGTVETIGDRSPPV
jgi:hypothetical protein